MLSKRYSHLIRLFAIISLSYFLAGCGDGDGPTPVPGEPCPVNGVVSFDSESYAASASSALISLTDTCIGNTTVVIQVDNGTDTINFDVPLDISGKGALTVVNFGATSQATGTIAIKEGDTLTVTYTGASTVVVTDTANITAVASNAALGVYTETYTDPTLAYSQILNAIDLGGKDTVTDEVTSAVIAPLDGVKSLRAAFKAENSPASGGNYNGFAFDFGPALINGTFEADDASGGNVPGATGWTTFEFVNTNSNIGPDSGPVSHDVGGTQSVTMFGPFTNDRASGAYQPDNTVVAGNIYTATAHVMNWAGDPLNNLAIMQFSFWDAPGGQTGGGKQIGDNYELIVDSTDDGSNIYLPVEDGADISDWTELSITEVAPAGTVSAEIFILHVQINAGTPLEGGSVFWDDISIVKGATATEPGGDISSYEVLRFGVNATAATSVVDLEVKLEDTAGNAASVFLSNYTSIPGSVAGWDLYEIPLVDFPAGVDLTRIISMGFFSASTTVTGSTSVAPTLVDATLYFDNVHFATGSAGAPPVLTGVLLDAAVEGVTFQTATQSGITNNLGEFKYIKDEMVTFSVGGIVLGTVTGAPLITPVELTGGADPVDQTATNQLVFLQSIDEDQDPLNGITVSAATLAAAATQTLDFTLDSAAFTAAVTPVVTAITSVNPLGPNLPVLTETEALDNFYVTYVAGGGTDTFGWSFPPEYPPYPGMASFPVDFEEAGGPYYIANFAGGVTTIIDNPQTTGNSSAKVAQMQKFADPESYGGSKITLGTIDFTSGSVFTMKVWASRPVPVTFKLDGLNVERIATHSGSSGWEDLTFDFTGFTGEGEREIVVFFDNGVVGDAAGDAANWTFYYDDILLQASAPITYQLIWSDEFDIDGVPDTDNWTIETGYGSNNDGWGNQEWQLYTDLPENIRVEAGNLVITANCSEAPAAPQNCGVRDGTVTSGKVNSLNKFSFRYGKVEARLKPPVGKASWPAFWMLGANFPDVGWPQAGEVDIMEMFQTNGSNPNTTHFTMHWCNDAVSSNPCLYDPGWIYYTDQLELGQSLGDDYHIFSAEWDASGITGKIDDIPYFYLAIDPGTMDEFLKEFFLILNVAMGGTLGSNVQPPDGSETWPQIMLADYVRVYQDVNNSDSSFTIGGGAPLDPLGVYSETHTDPVIAYSEIINVADYGGKDTVTDENSSDTVLEGAVSLKADFISDGPGLNYNGFIFNFGSAGGGVSLSNGTFEADDAFLGNVSGASGWTTFEPVFTYHTADNNGEFGPVSHDAGGTNGLKMYGPWSTGGAGGAFQFNNSIVAGTTYELKAHAMNWAPDALLNLGILQLSFYDGPDGTGNQLGGNIETFASADGTQDYTLDPQDGADISDWTEMVVSGVAPAGAVSAKAFLLNIQTGDPCCNGGSLYWDDVSLNEAAVASVDITGYDTLKFGINTAAASGLVDLEVKMEDSLSGAASVFLSAYVPSPSTVSGWVIYEIPLTDFVGIDQVEIVSLGYWNASSTVTGSTAVPPTLLDGTLYFDDIHFKVGLPAGPDLLTNGTFEADDAFLGNVSGASGWTTFEPVYTYHTADNNGNFGPVSHDAGGTNGLKMYGPWSTGGAGGAFQFNNSIVAGTTYELKAHAMNWAPDALLNIGILQLSFYDGPDGTGNQLGGNIETFASADGTQDYTLDPQDGADISDWTEMVVSGVAPAGAVSVKAFLLNIQTGDPCCNGGSLYWDDVSLRAQ